MDAVRVKANAEMTFKWPIKQDLRSKQPCGSGDNGGAQHLLCHSYIAPHMILAAAHGPETAACLCSEEYIGPDGDVSYMDCWMEAHAGHNLHAQHARHMVGVQAHVSLCMHGVELWVHDVSGPLSERNADFV